jgi:hypothetical protein
MGTHLLSATSLKQCTALVALEPTISPPTIRHDTTMRDTDLIAPDECLRFIGRHAKAQLEENFAAISAGVLFVHTSMLLVPKKSARRPRDGTTTALASAFGEMPSPDRRSNRFKLAKLCLDLAKNEEVRAWAVDAAKQNSIETCCCAQRRL